MMGTINIAIVEDQYLFKEMLVRRLSEIKEINVLFDVDNGIKLFRELYKHSPDIILLDIGLSEMTAHDIMGRLNKKEKKPKVIILTVYNQEEYIVKYINLGAAAFLQKDCEFNDLLHAIHEVYKKGFYHDKYIKDVLKKYSDIDDGIEELTSQEMEIAKLICDSKSSKEIAQILKLSPDTVYYHRTNISRKLKSKNEVYLYKYCQRKNII